MAADTVVLDASPFIHFDRVGELATLEKLLTGYRCVTTRAVIDEIRRGELVRIEDPLVEKLGWIDTVPVDELDVLVLFSEYKNRFGPGARNTGEASVLAWAEYHSAVAYIDDQVAYNIAKSRGVAVYRTLRLIVNAYRRGLLSEASAQRLVNGLAETGARFPQQARHDLFGWARSNDPPLL